MYHLPVVTYRAVDKRKSEKKAVILSLLANCRWSAHFDILTRSAANITSCDCGSGGLPDRLLVEHIEMS